MAKAAPLDANLLGVPKGAAAPAAEIPAEVLQPDPAPVSAPLTPVVARRPAPSAAEIPAEVLQPDPAPVSAPLAPVAARRPAPLAAPPPLEEPRTALTVRLPVSTQERLREASHRLRREKQHIVDEALLAWLDQQGF